jgi:6-pyruvoyltetrahydropterin/6-carboxytetrahydropterin synthase
MNIRVTKEFRFEMAHALFNHDGLCKNIHGHSYFLAITLKGKPRNENGNPKDGMVIDFGDLKKIVTEQIIRPFDHALMLNKNMATNFHQNFNDQKLILVDFQPTCENMLLNMVEKLSPFFQENIQLHHLMLRETSTSYAEWYADDNSLY